MPKILKRSVRIFDTNVAVPEIQEDCPGESLALGVRPEHITLSDTAPIRGRVFGAEYLGTMQVVTVETEHGHIKARMPSRIPVRLGDTVGLDFRAESLVIFDAATGRAIKSATNGSNGHV